MTVTEITRAVGSWSLRLADHTPRSVLRSLEYLGHLVVVPGRVDVAQYGDNLLTAARYVGVYRGQDRRDEYTLKGAGMAFWLGDEDGKGDVFETEINLAGATFAGSIAAVLPPSGSITTGTIHSVAGTYTGRHVYETPRKALDYITDIFEAEWRVNGNGTLDAGTVAQLYTVDPRAVLVRRADEGGSDLSYQMVPGQMGMATDVEDYTTRVLLLAEGEGSTIATGSADASVVPFKDIHGNTVKLTRLISESGTLSGNANTRAQLQLNRFSGSRSSVSLSTEDYDVKGNFVVGDYVYVYDPETGFVDNGNEITWKGQPINPMALRCIEMTWPIRAGWTVAFRRGSDSVWVDLSDYFVPESGESTVVVGEFNRSLLSAEGESLGNRPNTGGVDSTIPGTPSFTGFSTGSYQSAAAGGQTRSAIRAQWTTPLNTDLSTIQDGDHYEIRYRINQVIGYPAYWDDLEANFDWDDITGNSWDALYSEPVQASPEWTIAFVPWGTNAFTLSELSPGVNYEIQIRAVDNANPPHQGAWSASSFVITVGDTLAPSTPAAPIVAGSLIAIQVEHTLGKASGGTFNLELDLSHLEVHVGGSASFFTDGTTKVGELIATPGMIQSGIPAVGTFQIPNTEAIWVRVVAVDQAGNKSGPSVGVQITAQLIDNSHISSLSVSKLTAGTITATSVLASQMEVGPGGNIKLTNGRIEVFDNLNEKLLEFGQESYDTNAWGMSLYKPGIASPILELGKHYYGHGLLVNDQNWVTLVSVGRLPDGSYGLAAVNSLGQLVKLDTICFGQKAAYDTSADATSSTSYVGLGGPTVSDVLIGDTGRCKVTIGCQMDYATGAGVNAGGGMSFDVSGATTRSASNEWSLVDYINSNADPAGFQRIFRASYTHLFTDLTPGLHTFTAQYRSLVTAKSVSFADRTLIVEPF